MNAGPYTAMYEGKYLPDPMAADEKTVYYESNRR
jgi:hypothetical protein